MKQPDLRQLRYFVAVAEELHFGRAAERAGIAQPPLTQQIQKLEASLGCTLLVRGRKTQLTEAGRVLLEQSKRLLDLADRAMDATRRVSRGETGQLTVGVPPSVLLSALPTAIRRYRSQYPEVAFRLRELSTSAIEDAVGVGEIDLGFLRESEPAGGLQSTIVWQEPVVAVLPAGHGLCKRSVLQLRMLAGEQFVFFPRRLGPAFHDRLTGACAAAGFTPNIVLEATQWQSVVSFVEAGMGVSLAPGCVQKLGWKGVVYRPMPRLTTTVRACWRGDTPSPAAACFLKLAR